MLYLSPYTVGVSQGLRKPHTHTHKQTNTNTKRLDIHIRKTFKSQSKGPRSFSPSHPSASSHIIRPNENPAFSNISPSRQVDFARRLLSFTHYTHITYQKEYIIMAALVLRSGSVNIRTSLILLLHSNFMSIMSFDNFRRWHSIASLLGIQSQLIVYTPQKFCDD